MRPCGRYNLKVFSPIPIVTQHTINIAKMRMSRYVMCRFLYNRPAISMMSRFFNTFGFEPKKMISRGKARYRYNSPYKAVLLKQRNKHGIIPTVADKRIFLKFFVLKFFSAVFITLHHIYRECYFMIALSHLLYKEKL